MKSKYSRLLRSHNTCDDVTFIGGLSLTVASHTTELRAVNLRSEL